MTSENREELSKKISEMENDIYYPLGDDHFKIDHGKDYFAFFERLGDLHYWCVLDNEKIIGVAAGILREVNDETVWYLCDLKVRKEYRQKGIPKFIFKNAFIYNFKNTKVYKAYAVSMDSNDGKSPFKKIKKSTFGLLKKNKSLKIYSLTKNDYLSICHKLGKHRLVHTNDKKELILKSNNKKLSLFHINKKKLDQSSRFIDPNEHSVIMLSVYEGDDYDLILKEVNLKPDSSATVLTFRMNNPPEIFTDEI